jgi:hypothetical protein
MLLILKNQITIKKSHISGTFIFNNGLLMEECCVLFQVSRLIISLIFAFLKLEIQQLYNVDFIVSF